MRSFMKLHSLYLAGALHAEQKWYRSVVDRCSLGTSYALHPEIPGTRKIALASLFNTRKSAGLRIS